jgi:hypothetical protein
VGITEPNRRIWVAWSNTSPEARDRAIFETKCPFCEQQNYPCVGVTGKNKGRMRRSFHVNRVKAAARRLYERSK